MMDGEAFWFGERSLGFRATSSGAQGLFLVLKSAVDSTLGTICGS